MKSKVSLVKVYIPSENVVARTIQGELIIVPIISGIGGEEEDAIFSLNETGKAIWERMDGKKNLKDIAQELMSEFEGTEKEITKDIIGLTEELLKRNMVTEVK